MKRIESPALQFSEEPMLQALAPRPLSRLTYRILSLNLLLFVILITSLTYLSQTRKNLIEGEISNFASETELYALTVAANLRGIHTASIDNRILEDIDLHGQQQIFLVLADDKKELTAGALPARAAYLEKRDADLDPISRLIAFIEDMFSVEFQLPPFPGKDAILRSETSRVNDNDGSVVISAWSATDGGFLLSSKIPVMVEGHKKGDLFLLRRDLRIENLFAMTRIEIIRLMFISFLVTLSYSLYLAGNIGHPLRKLALAAEAYRLNRGREVEIPDLSSRKDEIGELSQAMREMVGALNSRITSIEQFAADVAHELKNPLASVKSAVETLERVGNEHDRAHLMKIINHDIARMNRLISDISQASRLDAELARDTLVIIDLRDVVMPLISMHQMAQSENPRNIEHKGFDKPLMMRGQSGRLAQVFDNLIANALSFSPPDKGIRVIADVNDERVKVMVEDDGPGIPSARLKKIFDRFYSERPVSETFGMHSGLGLSIARQIVVAHGGTIHAENRLDEHDHILGARFVVRFEGIRV